MSIQAETHQQASAVGAARLPVWRQLRWSLIFFFVLLAVVPAIVLVYITLSQTRGQAEDQVVNQLESVAELKQGEITTYIDDARASMNIIKSGSVRWVSQLNQTENRDTLETLQLSLVGELSRAVEAHSGFEEFFVFHPETGRVMASSDEVQLGKIVTRQPYFTPSLGGDYTQPPYYELGTQELTMVITSPVVLGGEVIGILAGRLNMDRFASIMTERTGLGESGETYLVSVQSNFLLTPSRFEGYELNRAYHSTGIDRALAGESGSGTYLDYRDPPETVIGVYRWVPEIQAALLAEVDEGEALSAFDDAQNNSIAFTAFAALAAALIGFMVASQFSRPLTRLTQTATALAGGDLSRRSDIQRRNEIGLLANTFNTMAQQLQDFIGSLEQRVQARTQDLQLTLEVGQLAMSNYRQPEFLGRITDYIRDRFDLYYTQVYLVDEAGRYAVLRSGTGSVGEQLLARGHKLDLRETSIVARAYQTRQPVLVSDTETSAIHKANPLLPQTRSEVAVPLIVGDTVLGVLDMQAVGAETFNEENVSVFNAMASQLAAALAGAAAHAEAQTAVERAATVNRRLTSDTWEPYLGRYGRGERVGYEYNLHGVQPLAAPDAAAVAVDAPDGAHGNGSGGSGANGSGANGSGANGSASGGSFAQQVARPVTLRDQTIGTILIGEDGQRDWTDDELLLIENVAERVAQAAEQFRAFDETQKRATEMQTVAELATEASSTLDPDAMLRDIVNQIRDRFGLYHAHIYLLDDDTQNLVLAAGAGDAGEIMVNEGRSIALSNEGSLVARAARSRAGVVVNDVMAVGDFMPNPLLPDTRSEMAIPMVAGETLIGVLDVQSEELGRFTGEDVAVKTTLASQLAIALNNARTIDVANQRLAVIENAPVLVGMADLQGNTIYLNPYGRDLIGYEALDDVLGTPIVEFATPEEAPKYPAERIPATMRDGVWYGETYLQHKGGTAIPIEQTLFPVMDEDGHPVLIATVISDITERKAAEREIEDRERQFRAIFEQANDAIFLLRQDGTFAEWNSRVLEMFGVEADDLLGKTPADYSRPIQPDGRDSTEKAIEKIQAAAAGEPQFFEWVHTRQDGTEFWADISLNAIEVRGEAMTQAVIRDITERMMAERERAEREQLMRAIIDTTNDWIFVKDTNYRYTVVNEAFAYQYGQLTPEEMVGKDDYELGTPVELIEGNPEKGIVGFRVDDRKVIEDGETVHNPNDVVPYQDGQLHILDMNKLPLRDADGNIVGVVGYGRDVTERVRDEELIRKRAAEMQTVAELATEASSTLDPDAMLWDVANLTKDRFDLYHAHIYLLDDAGQNLVLAAGAGDAGQQMVERGHSISLNREHSLVARAARSREGVIANDVTEAVDFMANPLLPDTRAEMAIPMIAGDTVVGVLDVQSTEVGRFTAEDVAVKSTLASQLAVALTNARTIDVANQRLAIIETANDLISLGDLDGNVLYMNPAGLQMLGWDTYEDKSIPQVYVPEMIERVAQEGLPIVMTGESWRGETGIQGADGRSIPVDQTLVPIADDQGEIVFIATIMSDITERKRDEEIIRKRAEEMQTVAELATEASSTLDIDELLVNVANLTKERFDLYHAHIYLLDDTGRNLVLAAGAGDVGEMMVEEGRRIALANPGSLVARAARDRAGVIVNDVTEAPDYLPNPMLPRTRAEMAIPMIAGDALVGVLDVQADMVGRFTDEDVAVKSTLASQLATAVTNARLFNNVQDATFNLQERMKELAALQEIGSYAEEGLPLVEYLDRVADRIPPSMQYPDVCVAAVEMDGTVYGHQATLTAPSQLAVPLGVAHDPDARLIVAYTEERAFLAEETPHLEALAERISTYIERLRAEDLIRKRAAELQTVAELATEASSTLDVDAMLRDVVDQVRDEFGLYHAHIYLLDGDTQNLVLAAGAGDAGEIMVNEGRSIALSNEGSLVARAARSRAGVVVNDVMAVGDFMPNPLLPDTRSEMAIPMLAGDAVVGVLDVQSEELDRFTDEDVAVKSTLASQLAIAISNARTFEIAQQRLAIIENAPFTVAMNDLDGNVVYANPAAATLLRLDSIDDILSRGIPEFVAEEDLPHALEAVQSAMETGLWQGEQYLMAADGTRIPVDQTIITIYDDEHRPQYQAAIFSDITERKRSQEEIESQRRTLEALLANLPVGVFMIDGKTGAPQIANDRALEMLGRGLAPDAQTDQLAEVYAAYLAGTDEQYPTDQMPLTRGMMGEHAHIDDMEIRRPDGAQLLLEVQGAPITDTDGTVISSVAVFQDITQRRAAEQERERLLADTEEQAQRMALLNEMAEAMGHAQSSEDVYRIAAQHTDKMLGAARASVALLTADGNAFEVFGLDGVQGTIPVGAQLPVEGTALGECVRSRRLLRLDDLSQVDYLETNQLAKQGLGSSMSAPLSFGDRVVGTINVAYHEPNSFDDRDASLFLQVASLLSSNIQSQRLLEQTQEALDETQLLYDASERITSADSSQALVAAVVETVRLRAINRAVLFSFQRDSNGEIISIMATANWYSGVGSEPSEVGRRYSLDEFPFMRLAQGREPIFIDDLIHDDRADEQTAAVAREQNVRATVVLPLWSGARQLGVLFLESDEAYHFSETEVHPFTALASQMAVALDTLQLFEQTERRAAEMQTVAELSAEASSMLDLGQLLWDVSDLTKERFGLYHAHIYLLDATGRNLVLTAGAGDAGRQMVAHGHVIPLSHPQSLVASVGRTRKPRIFNDVSAEGTFMVNPLLPETRSEMAVPMVVGDQLIGVLDVQSDRFGRFTDEDITVKSTLASQLAITVNNARLFEQTEKRAAELETVAEVGAEASASLEMQQLLASVTNLTKERFGLYHAHIYLLDSDGDWLELAAGAGRPGEIMVARGQRIPASHPNSLVAQCARNRQAVVVNNVEESDEFLPNPLLPLTRAEMAIPMIAGNTVVGVLDVQSEVTHRFTAEDVAIKSTLAAQVAAAIQNARLFAEQVETADRLREVDRLKSEFLASMSHELRTPLNSIIGYAEVLLDGIDGDLTEDMEEDISAIHGSGKHLLNLINDVLDLAKIEAGQMDLVTENFSFAPVAKEQIDTSKVLTKDKAVELVLDVPEDLPQLHGDALRIRQVLNNLVSNAVKFTEEGEIRVAARVWDQDPSMVRIMISDTGIGLTDEQQGVVFDRFRQVDQSHTRRAGGTGLGLSITRQLIEMHGGDIWVESTYGEGSQFYFTLPVARDDESDGADAEA